MRHPAVARFWIVLSVAFAAAAICGCAQFGASQIDPSGERLFVQPPAQPIGDPRMVPPGLLPWDNAQLILSPSQVAAPVGSQVIVVAGVRDQEGYLQTNERIEWALAPGSVGGFIDVNRSTLVDYLVLDFNAPGVIDSAHAVGSTSRSDVRLARGTPNPADDITVLRGQAWISVGSPVEGTTYVTAFAPSVYNCHLETAIIHWIDADFCFPPPAITPLGRRHVFTTVVNRHTDRAPCVGWKVRYRITAGPPAGFAPSGDQDIEAPVNPCGQASVEIFQPAPAAGSSTISIEVIRPISAGVAGRPLVIGNGSTSITWGAQSPPIGPSSPTPTFGQPAPGGGQGVPSAAGKAALQVQILGPDRASVGEQVRFELVITNLGLAKATGLLIKNRFDEGLEHVAARSPIERDLTDLAPGESHRIRVQFRVVRPGQWRQEAEVTGADGLRATAQTYITAMAAAPGQSPASPAPAGSLPNVSVRKTGRTVAAVGQVVQCTTELRNTGARTWTNLTLADRYDDSFKPIQATDGYQFNEQQRTFAWTIDALLPGSSVTRVVECQCVKASVKACSTATLTSAEGLQSTGEWCMQVQPGADVSPSTPPPGTAAAPAAPSMPGQPRLNLTVADLRDPVTLGKNVTYEILVKNEGQASDQQVVVVATVPDAMQPVALGTSGPARYVIEGQVIRFEPVEVIRPGETLPSYRVLLLTRAPGDVKLRVTLTSKNLAQPITREESTHVLATQ